MRAFMRRPRYAGTPGDALRGSSTCRGFAGLGRCRGQSAWPAGILKVNFTATVNEIRSQTGDGRREWEYRKPDLNDVPRMVGDIDALCDAGRDGWELA